MLDEGVYRSQSELARGEGVSTAAVSIGLEKLRKTDGPRPAALRSLRQDVERSPPLRGGRE